ncbi:MAG: ribose-phosphate diphosphokinase [Alphaproteobacteria bacterium]|nr:ribose-phosphate diphosphokinase [Alphaproteobacteria bacterium]
MKADIKLVAGNSNRALAEAIGAYLSLPLAKAQVRRFADMEIFVEIQENVRGQDVFIIQSTSFPTNDHLMELLIITDALRRASAKRITAVIPYFGYARQDRKAGPRTPISAKLVANLIAQSGVDRILTVDLHAGQIQGFFDIPTDNLFAAPLMARDIKEHLDTSNTMVVSPDVGGVVRARALAKRIDAPLAIVDKRRERAGESEVMNIIGDVSGRSCILVDDIVDSGGTLCNAADALLANGAKEVYAYITHGVLSGGAVARARPLLPPLFWVTYGDSLMYAELAAAEQRAEALQLDTIATVYRNRNTPSSQSWRLNLPRRSR